MRCRPSALRRAARQGDANLERSCVCCGYWAAPIGAVCTIRMGRQCGAPCPPWTLAEMAETATFVQGTPAGVIKMPQGSALACGQARDKPAAAHPVRVESETSCKIVHRRIVVGEPAPASGYAPI